MDDKGFATLSNSLVSAVQAHINKATVNSNGNNVSLPPVVPLFGTTPPTIPPVIDTNPVQAGAAFGRRGSHQPPQSRDSSVGQVSINGWSYTGSIFDANGNRIA